MNKHGQQWLVTIVVCLGMVLAGGCAEVGKQEIAGTAAPLSGAATGVPAPAGDSNDPGPGPVGRSRLDATPSSHFTPIPADPSPTITSLPPTATPTPAPTSTPAPTATPPPTATATPVPSPTPRPDPVATGLIALPPVKNTERWIDFNRKDATTRLLEGRQILKELSSAFGYGLPGGPDDYYSTAPGTYWVYEKREALYQDIIYSGQFFMGWVGFDPYRANGFHSFLLNDKGEVVDSRLGPVSHGCIRVEDWRAVFEFAVMGMPVVVHD